MDNYLNTFREVLSLRGLSGHTLKEYCTYIRAYLDYLHTVLHKLPEDVSWQEMREFVRWLQKERSLADRTMNCAISQLRFFTIYVLHKPWDDSRLPMRRFRICGKGFFIPAKVLAAKFRGKLLSSLDALHKAGKLSFSPSCSRLKDTLYSTAWCPDIRETFNGFGNAIEYLGRYADRIAITNARVKAVSPDSVTFTAKDYKNNYWPAFPWGSDL